MTPTVPITGASQDIGTTALKFAQEGYNVVLAARQPDRLEAAAAEVRLFRLMCAILTVFGMRKHRH
jgi:short-subunit dehydrogenase